MTKKLSIFLIITSSLQLMAQFGPQQIISVNAGGVLRSIQYDLDQDGDLDVISGSNGDWSIAWYENLNGQGDFSSEHIINNTIITLEAMELADMDNDGDMDILYKTLYLDKIAWLENLDGFGTFGEERLIADIDYPYTISMADIDGDGDIDVFANLYNDSFSNRLVWYENLDGLGNFSEEHLIEIGDFYISILLNFDLDNDGDFDLITSYESYNPSIIIWYENIDGQGTFSESQEIYQFDFFQSDWTSISNMAFADINGDGKMDIIVSTYHDDYESLLEWFENLDAQGNFGEPQLIHINETSLGSLRNYDIDNDNDQDLLVSYFYGAGTKIAWFENTNGFGDFGPESIISTEVLLARDATAGDLNNDGLWDVVSSSFGDNKVAWYENSGLGFDSFIPEIINIVPNPTSTNTEMFYTLSRISYLTLYDTLGRVVPVIWDENIIYTDVISPGMYFLQIEFENGHIQNLKLLKE